MFEVLAIAAAMASRQEIPSPAWRCENQVEVWCAVDGCAATDPDQATPMDIYAAEDGALSICAYSGCWEGQGRLTRIDGRSVWTAASLDWVAGAGGLGSPATLLVIENEGVGFVRAGGFATPLLCKRAAPNDD